MKLGYEFAVGNDEAHKLQASTGEVNAQDFFERAKSALTENELFVREKVVPNLENYPAKWHPLGFMVYHLGLNPELGSLRLHIWPSGHRISEQSKGGEIHDHAWHLASKVLVGTYIDEIFSLERADAQDPDAQQLFITNYVPGQPNQLAAMGEYVRPVCIERRAIQAGGMHTIEAGIFHTSRVPFTDTVATLVIDSPSWGNRPRVLFPATSRLVYSDRPDVSVRQAMTAKQQLLAA